MADTTTYFSNGPGAGQTGVVGAGADAIAARIAQMQAQAVAQSSQAKKPVSPTTPTISSGIASMNQTLASGSSSSISSAPIQNQATQMQSGIASASSWQPERVASWVDASGVYHPASFTRPNESQMAQEPWLRDYAQQLNIQDQKAQAIEAERNRLQQEQRGYEDRLASSAVQARQESGQAYARSRGQASMQLARMGALGTSASGLSYLQDLDARQAMDEQKIVLQYENLLAQAKQSYEKNQFDLTGQQLAQLDTIRESFGNAKGKWLDDQMKYAAIKDLELKQADATISRLVQSGIAKEALPSNYLEHMDAALGLPPGTMSATWDTAKEAEEAAELQAQIKQAKEAAEIEKTQAETSKIQADVENQMVTTALNKTFGVADRIVALQDKIPSGQSIKIGEFEYFGWNTAGIKNGVEVDNNGNATAWTFDPSQAGDPVSRGFRTTPLGNIGAQKDGWERVVGSDNAVYSYNRFTGDYKLASPIGAQVSWNEVIPTGTKGGQCGTFVRLATGVRVGNTLTDKVRVVDPTIGTATNPVKIGDVIVTSEGGDTGHVAVVEGMTILPNGQQAVTLMESNYKYDEKVTHGRTLALNAPVIKGFVRGQLIPELRTGTDAGPLTVPGREADPLDTPIPSNIALASKIPEGLTFRQAAAIGYKVMAPAENQELAKPISTELASQLRVPIGTTMGELKAAGIIPPEALKPKNYTLKEMTGEDGKTQLYVIDLDTRHAEPIRLKPDASSLMASTDENLIPPKPGYVADVKPKPGVLTVASADSEKTSKIIPIDDLTKLNAKLPPEKQLPVGSTYADAQAAGIVPGGDTNRGRQYREDALSVIKDLESHGGLKGAVGIGFFKSIPGMGGKPLVGTKASDFVAMFNRLKALVTIPGLEALRGLGQMSDREFNTIAAAASALDLSMSEKEFKRQLEILRSGLEEGLGGQRIKIRRKADGVEGDILERDFDPSKYERLD